MKWPFGIALALLLSAPAVAQDQSERIKNFVSDITVAGNGQLTVTEMISVNSTGNQIRHGIYRDFPTRYQDAHGNRIRVRFDVTQVVRDGRNEPYSIESLDNGVRVRIGDADTLIAPGEHEYSITYITDRQIGFFENYDELYWNVTGNGWAFPIDRVRADIHLPPGARILQQSFYTGPQGATGSNARYIRLTDNSAEFVTTAPLGSYEGLTVAIGFAKGAVSPPSETELRRAFILDNAGTVVALLGLLAVIIYYVVVWHHFGRDPARGVVIPLFAPPSDLSPAALRFIRRMSYDRKCFSAALIDMAVKGYLKISEQHGTFRLDWTGRSSVAANLAAGERSVGSAMFAGSENSIELKQVNHSKIARSISALKSALKTEYEGQYFVTNLGWFAGGMGILALSGLGAALLSEDAGAAGFMLFWLAGWTTATSFLLHNAAMGWAGVFGRIGSVGSRIANFFSAVFMSAFAVPFLGGWIFGVHSFSSMVSVWTMAALSVGGIAAYLFYHLLKAPTLAGARLLDQIEGFSMFLSTTEKERLEILHPPNVTPELFEKYLPYAIALDCENQWSKKFEAAAAAAGRAPDTSYSPGWYSGPSYSRLGTGGFASAIGSSIAGAAASASTAPGSSSGSGGGGSSGGGGGGGGGGGW